MTSDVDQPAVSRRAAAVLTAAIVVGFVAGAALFGLGGDAAPAIARAQSGDCTAQPLRYVVTDSPSVRDAEDRFEHDPDAIPVPDPGIHRTALDPIASLHAALHGFVVLYHRPGAGPAGTPSLASLLRAARERNVPVVVSPRTQRAALVAIRSGAALTCTGTTAEDIAHLRAFVAAQFPAIAR